MNVMNNSSGDEEQVECPLCMEPLEVDDLHFYPCTCGYQICRFCWHRIRTDENELCPACRKAYPENPADFTPLSQEQIAAFKAEKRQRDQQRKAKISENRKHLANVRVVQKNLVFVVGLPPRLADPEILKKHEYFGKYGKIHKVVINPSSTYAGVPSASAYVTYINNNDALKAIQSVNNINMDGRLIKTSLGTTKYCSHFMKNQTCPKPDCMYLHELGDQEASFTKEEMHQGKHQEYEKRLHDTMQAQLGLTVINGVSSGGTLMNGSSVGGNNSTSGGVGNGNGNGGNGTGTGTTTNGILANGTNGSGKTGDSKHISDITNGPIQSKEAWPSLSTTPIDGSTHGNGGGGSNKENKINGKTVGSNKENGSRKHEKSRTKGGRKHRGTRDSDRNRERDRDLHGKDHGGKDSHTKRNSSSSSSSNNRSSSSSNHVKDSTISSGANNVTNGGGISSSRKNVNAVTDTSAFGATSTVSTTVISNGNGKSVDTGVNGHLTGDEGSGKEVLDNGKDLKQITIGCGNSSSITTNNNKSTTPHLDDLDDDDDELDFEDLDNDALSSDNDGKTDTPSLSSSGSSRAGGDSGSILSETPSGKSSPTAFPDPVSVVNNVISTENATAAIVAVKDETVPSSGANMSTATTAITNGINSSSSSSISSSNFSSSSPSASTSDDKSANGSTRIVIELLSDSLFDSGNDDNDISIATTVTTSPPGKQQLPQQQQQQQQQSQPQNGMNKINSLIDNNTSRFAKLGIFDDNSSFFSHSTIAFDPYNYNKLEGVNGHLDGIQHSGLTSSRLPDLLSGTNDSNEQHTKEILKNLNNIQQQQQHHLFNNAHLQQQLNGLGLGNGGIDSGTTDDWEAAFSKYVMRNKLDVEHHEELLRLQELQKRNIINNGLNGASQFNGFNGEYADYFHNTNELNSRLLSQQQQHAHQRLQQQQQQPPHADMNHIYAGNMSKFFDFHKNQQQQAAQHQQQQQQQNQPFLLNGHSSLAAPDPMNLAGLLENSRLSSHFLEQHSLLGSQHVQKQRMLNGQLNAHSILLNGANPQQPSQSPQQQQPNNRLHNPQQQPFSQQQNPVADDDLGFDPFIETQKALAELINDEISQQQMPQSAATTAPNHSKLLENVQRTRMPPPGFNHMNAFGFGVPRPHVSSSKILPFMNLANNSQPQQQQPQQPSWGQQLQQQQQQQFMGFQQNDQNHLAQSQPPSGNNKAGYGNNFPDWTSFDPAIVSFRQFSFMNGPNQPSDMFLSAQQAPNQLNPQGMQPPGQAFGPHGINMQSNLINQQQQQQQPSNPQAQVKYDDFFLHHHQLQHQQQQQHQQQLQQQPQQQQQQAPSNMNEYFTKLSYRMLSS